MERPEAGGGDLWNFNFDLINSAAIKLEVYVSKLNAATR